MSGLMASYKRNIPDKYVGRKIYSISRLQSYNTCQYGFYLNYILRKSGKQNIYSILGGKVHSILEELQFGIIDKSKALEKFRLSVFESLNILGYKFPSDKTRDNFIQCVEHFLINYEPIKANEVKSELEFYTEIQDIVVMGFIDLIVYNYDNTIEVIDYKTSSKYSKKDLDKYGMQLTLYAIALEREYGVKIDKVKWNMLKYCTITWQGATKERKTFCPRNEIVKSLRSEIKKDLSALGMNEIAIYSLMEEAESRNDLSLFPSEIQNKYTISDGYVEYELSERTKDLLLDFIIGTVAKIESTPSSIEGAWIPKDIDKDMGYFCNVLCDFSLLCPHYKKWVKENENKFKDKTDTTFDMMKELFGK